MSLENTDAPHKAAAVEVVQDVDVAALARAALASCCDQIRLNVAGARRGEDPAFTHQLRVGTRRLRVALRLFRGLLEEAQLGWLQSELKWVFAQLGAQRELDVLLRDTLDPRLQVVTDDAGVLLRKLTADARAARCERVQAALEGRRFGRLMRALDALPESVQSDPRRAKKWARKKLSQRREATLAHYQAALAGDAEARHELRKQFKKLRYASELCSAMFKGKRVKRHLASLERVQELLGALNDVASGRHELARLSHGLHAELGSALAECAAAFAEREAQQLAKLEPALRAYADEEPFWA